MNTQRANIIARKLTEVQAVGLENRLEREREQLDYFTNENVNYQSAITNNLRRMRAAGDVIAIVEQQLTGDGYGSHLVNEWNTLRDHPRLADAKLSSDNWLTLTTTDDIRLHSPDRGDTRWLGAFEIGISLTGGEIRLTNLNTRRGGRDHPHVVNGGPCFGSNWRAFSELQASGDLYPLFELLLQYLETLNLSDEYGRYGAYWFEQEDAESGYRAAQTERVAA